VKTIGLLGGMSWESTVPYYQIINRAVKERLGGLHSAKIALYSVDFAEVEERMRSDRWEDAAEILIRGASAIESAGADFLVLCTNTLHKVAPQIEKQIEIPLLHIADVTAEAVRARGIRTVGFLATRYTMEHDFYRERLEKASLRVVIPEKSDRDEIHRVIFEELVVGRFERRSRAMYGQVIERLVQAGTEAIVLACTEIGLLIDASDSAVPLFDTTEIHARAAVECALS
jgi:aspartate racemase